MTKQAAVLLAALAIPAPTSCASIPVNPDNALPAVGATLQAVKQAYELACLTEISYEVDSARYDACVQAAKQLNKAIEVYTQVNQ